MKNENTYYICTNDEHLFASEINLGDLDSGIDIEPLIDYCDEHNLDYEVVGDFAAWNGGKCYHNNHGGVSVGAYGEPDEHLTELSELMSEARMKVVADYESVER